MIAMVNSLRHSLTLWKQLGSELSLEEVQFMSSFPVFRAHWFTIPKDDRTNRLFQFAADAILISFRLLEKVAMLLHAWVVNKSTLSYNQDWRFTACRRKLVFSSPWSLEKAVYSTVESCGKQFFFPKEIGVLLTEFAQSAKTIGKHVSKCMHLNNSEWPQLSQEHGIIIGKYVQAIEHYQTFHEKKFHLSAPDYHTYWLSSSSEKVKKRAALLFHKQITRRHIGVKRLHTILFNQAYF